MDTIVLILPLLGIGTFIWTLTQVIPELIKNKDNDKWH